MHTARHAIDIQYMVHDGRKEERCIEGKDGRKKGI